MIDIDFSEKLKVPITCQAQSEHWNEKTVIIHSWIIKQNGTKSYHAYLSDDTIQDKSFVNNVLQKMLSECDIFQISNLIVKSDNCFSQYKCAKKFYGLSQIANQFNVNVIHIFVIAGHGKGQVDQVGGLAKDTIRREVAAEKNFSNANDMVHCLSENMLKVNHQFF